MTSSSSFEKALEVLETYHGRDQVLRTLEYACKLLSGCCKGKFSSRLNIIAEEFGGCRTILRLFDDLPMLAYSLSYGLGRKEPDRVLRWSQVLSNFIDQLYYPLEHVAWAADKQIISVSSTPWWVLAIGAWALSLYIGIVRAVRSITILRKQKDILKNGLILSNPTQQSNLDYLFLSHVLTIVHNTSDLVNAIHWLPKGFLWAGKLTSFQIGLFGLISSVLSIYRSILVKNI